MRRARRGRESCLPQLTKRRRRRSLLVVQESTIHRNSHSALQLLFQPFSLERVARVLCLPSPYVPVCAPADFHEFADQLKGTRLEVTDRRFCATTTSFQPTACTTFFLRLERSEACSFHSRGINIAPFLSLVVPPVSFQDLGNSTGNYV